MGVTEDDVATAGEQRFARVFLVLIAAVLIALGISAIASGQTYTEADFRQVGFIQIQNVHTGQHSRPLCGEGGGGIYFNSSDLQAGSCLLIDPFKPEVKLTVINNVVWFPMNELAGFYETQCYSQWALFCGRPPGVLDDPVTGCTRAVRWQAFRADDLTVFLGQSPTLGGAITPVAPNGFTCPIPAPRTPTATPVPGVPSQTPAPPTPVPPTLTPNPSCPGEIRQLSDGGCYCVATQTRVACPGPAAPTATHIPTLTPTPLQPTAAPNDTPTPQPTMTPTWTPAPSSTAPPPPSATPSSGSGGGCRSKAATVPIVVPAIAVWLAGWRRKLRREHRNR